MTAAATDVLVAADVGGTSMKCALVDLAGTVRHTERHPTGREHGPDAVVDRILDVVAGLADGARERGYTPRGVGIAVPGVIDEARGIAVNAANLGWRDVPLRDAAEARTGLPTALGHDVRAGGIAEARIGAGRGHRHVLFVAIGTGIAGAHLVDGNAYPGGHGAACELGHIVVRPGGAPCGCGGYGHLEAIASAANVARRYREATGDTAATAADVAARANGGEAAAVAVWRETVEVLADGFVTGIALFDPDVIVVGGGLAEAGEALLRPLEAAVAAQLTFHHRPWFVLAALGDEAGCVGAAQLAKDRLADVTGVPVDQPSTME